MFGGKGYAEYTLNPPAGIQRARRQVSSLLRSTIVDHLSLRFRTEVGSGTLFQIGRAGNNGGDFFSVELQEGRIILRANLGSGEERVNLGDGTPRVDDAVWHSLELERVALDVQLTLDSVTFSHTLTGGHLYLDVGYSQFYAGGVPVPNGVGSGYIGCLEDIRIEENSLPTSEQSSLPMLGSTEFASVIYRGNSSVNVGCGLRGCFPDPCKGETCIERGARGFSCSCQDGSIVVSGPCTEPGQVTPFLLIIIIVAVVCTAILVPIITAIGEGKGKGRGGREVERGGEGRGGEGRGGEGRGGEGRGGEGRGGEGRGGEGRGGEGEY